MVDWVGIVVRLLVVMVLLLLGGLLLLLVLLVLGNVKDTVGSKSLEDLWIEGGGEDVVPVVVHGSGQTEKSREKERPIYLLLDYGPPAHLRPSPGLFRILGTVFPIILHPPSHAPAHPSTSTTHAIPPEQPPKAQQPMYS